jgi:hypothetical protein
MTRGADGKTIPSKLLAYQLISGEITQGDLAERLRRASVVCVCAAASLGMVARPPLANVDHPQLEIKGTEI